MKDLILENELDVSRLHKDSNDVEDRILFKLQLLFDKYIQHINDWDMCDIYFTMYEEMVKIYRYNNLPRILTDGNYKELLKNELFRSAMSNKHHKEFIFDKDYHVGKASFCNGILTTEDNIHINHYAVIFGSDDLNNNVMRLKLLNKNGVDYLYLVEMLRSEIGWHEKYDPSNKDIKKFELLKRFLACIKNDQLRKDFSNLFKEVNNLAVYLGYDYIAKRNTNCGDLKIILNRGIVAVSESEANRIKSLYNNANLDA